MMKAGLPQGLNFSGTNKKLSRKSGVLLALGIIVSLGVTVYILFFTGPNLGKQMFQVLQKAPVVALKTENKNPFKKETQYVNPFNLYKSPFYNLKQSASDNKP